MNYQSTLIYIMVRLINKNSSFNQIFMLLPLFQQFYNKFKLTLAFNYLFLVLEFHLFIQHLKRFLFVIKIP